MNKEEMLREEVLEELLKLEDNNIATKYLEYKRWKNKVICVYCSSSKVCKHTEKTKERWQCWNCKKSFSATVGTIFHHSHVPLTMWFRLINLMYATPQGLSPPKAARILEMNRPTIWRMMNKITRAMGTEEAKLLEEIALVRLP